jgi:hypothetical protein
MPAAVLIGTEHAAIKQLGRLKAYLAIGQIVNCGRILGGSMALRLARLNYRGGPELGR